MKTIEKILILFLVVFGLLYSSYLAVFTEDYYIGFVFILITLGFSSTIYVLDKNINYRIIFYIWLAIVLVSSVVLLLQWVFSAFELFRL
ncbi:MAG: hypothetical protein V1818_00355 [Candidatus Aenigmatarchaeota archaeon]